MKISYEHLKKNIEEKPSLSNISNSLFQLGHEHTIEDNIFDIEFTPNRGDCLSIRGLLRDLNAFYISKIDNSIFNKPIDNFDFNFKNSIPKICPNISFLKIEIEKINQDYSGPLKKYFEDMKLNKNNFFTDISNYISYETGQPTHCYDASKINKKEVHLKEIKENVELKTLLDKKITLDGKNIIFSMDDKVINLAGVIGGAETACTNETTEVIIECAHFLPEYIIGKSLKYDIQSEASYKFERGVDPLCHDYVLRRFIKIVEDHTHIKNIQIFSDNNYINNPSKVNFDETKISEIIGIKLEDIDYKSIFERLGFKFSKKDLIVPSYRNDIKNLNDLAEELCRVIGYDNIPTKKLNISLGKALNKDLLEKSIRSFMIDHGFYEVINNPFVSNNSQSSIQVDNPLDSNKSFLRLSMKDSLINNLLYNERRQKDSIKFFEISDLYENNDDIKQTKKIGIIASGRVGRNYKDFSKKIDEKFLISIFNKYLLQDNISLEYIQRDLLDTKIKEDIFFLEINVSDISRDILDYKPLSKISSDSIHFNEISEFPISIRDISFSIKDFKKVQLLEEVVFSINDSILKEKFIFDYYKNINKEEIKIGYRFIFQSKEKTLTDNEVDYVYNKIISEALSIDSISIPGLNNSENN